MTTTERIYKVSPKGYTRMPKGTEGKEYIRRVCRDGAVTFLPVKVEVKFIGQEPAQDDQQPPQETTNPPAEEDPLQPGQV